MSTNLVVVWISKECVSPGVIINKCPSSEIPAFTIVSSPVKVCRIRKLFLKEYILIQKRYVHALLARIRQAR